MNNTNSKNLKMMNNIATDIVVKKAMKDHMEQKKQKVQKNTVKNYKKYQGEDSSDYSMDSDEEEIMRKMKEKMTHQPQAKEIRQSKGTYVEKNEKEFFELIKNKTERIICHFYHQDFLRCKLIDKHMNYLAQGHSESLFVRINAETSHFLVQKLSIKVLPAIYFFYKGEVKDKIVGFDEFGGNDDFTTKDLANRLSLNGAIDLKQSEKFILKKKQVHKNKVRGESSDEEDYQLNQRQQFEWKN